MRTKDIGNEQTNLKWKVMIIDDDIGLLRLLETVLKNMDLLPISACGGLEAIALINGGTLPDLILLDIKMPGLTGFETFDQIKSIPQLNKVKIIAFTAYAHEWEQDCIMNYGFDDYISKPFKKADFMKIVFQALATCPNCESQRAKVSP